MNKINANDEKVDKKFVQMETSQEILRKYFDEKFNLMKDRVDEVFEIQRGKIVEDQKMIMKMGQVESRVDQKIREVKTFENKLLVDFTVRVDEFKVKLEVFKNELKYIKESAMATAKEQNKEKGNVMKIELRLQEFQQRINDNFKISKDQVKNQNIFEFKLAQIQGQIEQELKQTIKNQAQVFKEQQQDFKNLKINVEKHQ